MGRLRFQASFTEELVLKRQTTIKHELSPDTVIQSELTLRSWLLASLEPGASLGRESSALRPPTEHSGRILKASHLRPSCLITSSHPARGLPAAGQGPAAQARPSHHPRGPGKDGQDPWEKNDY